MATNTSPVATASASGGAVGAFVIILCWILSQFHIIVPSEIAAAMMVLLTPVAHFAAVKHGFDMDEPAKPKEVTQP